IEFLPDDPAKLFAIFQKSLLFSSDTGKSWREISTPLPHYTMLRDMVMVDAVHGWIVSEAGIAYTSNGGFASVVDKQQSVTTNHILYQNYPNPFNSSTQISFYLSNQEKISLKVYNIKGEQIAVLLNDQYLFAGKHQFEFTPVNVPSGIYIYRLKLKNNQYITRRMILLK
ncbi:MAG: T9SS type A sorting domain-containing protein, partial [bacterium]|nr:T9SS type A sorting domain-containing protein [bacterium]